MLPGWPAFHSGHTECPQLLSKWASIKLGSGHNRSAQNTSPHLWVAQLHYLVTAAGPDFFICIMGSEHPPKDRVPMHSWYLLQLSSFQPVWLFPNVVCNQVDLLRMIPHAGWVDKHSIGQRMQEMQSNADQVTGH